MSYCAIWNDAKTLQYNPGLLDGEADLFPQICPNMPQLWGMVSVREPRGLRFWLDSVDNHALCGMI